VSIIYVYIYILYIKGYIYHTHIYNVLTTIEVHQPELLSRKRSAKTTLGIQYQLADTTEGISPYRVDNMNFHITKRELYTLIFV